jgi:hypothetical protein
MAAHQAPRLPPRKADDRAQGTMKRGQAGAAAALRRARSLRHGCRLGVARGSQPRRVLGCRARPDLPLHRVRDLSRKTDATDGCSRARARWLPPRRMRDVSPTTGETDSPPRVVAAWVAASDGARHVSNDRRGRRDSPRPLAVVAAWVAASGIARDVSTDRCGRRYAAGLRAVVAASVAASDTARPVPKYLPSIAPRVPARSPARRLLQRVRRARSTVRTSVHAGAPAYGSARVLWSRCRTESAKRV